MAYDVDLFVIGGGSGGVRAARTAAATGAKVVEPRLRPEDADMKARPLITSENFSANYIQRNVHKLAKQGDRGPWVFSQDYEIEKRTIPEQDLDDGTLEFR